QHLFPLVPPDLTPPRQVPIPTVGPPGGKHRRRSSHGKNLDVTPCRKHLWGEGLEEEKENEFPLLLLLPSRHPLSRLDLHTNPFRCEAEEDVSGDFLQKLEILLALS
ncbi:E4 protein, partial [Crocuta crocuta papillomavirus 1]